MNLTKIAFAIGILISLTVLGAEAQDIHEKEQVYEVVEQMPEYPGGKKALMEFIAQNVRYPEDAKREKITGKVFVNFIVDKTGKVKSIKIVRGVAPSLDKESVRVIGLLPDFQPGKQNGGAVNVSYTVPINYELDSKTKTIKKDTWKNSFSFTI